MEHKYDYDLLRAAGEIFHFLLQERDLPNMLQGICDRLVEGTGYESSLLVLLDRSMGGMITAETGLKDVFPAVMERLREGSLPRCGIKLLETDGLSTVTCESDGCEVCGSMGKSPSGGVCTVIRCTSSLYGFLLFYETEEWKTPKEDYPLVERIAGGVSQALRRLFSEEEAKHREEEMRKVEERYELALYASQAGLWDWNIKTGEMYTSPNQREYLDYRNGDAAPGGAQRYIHPDDREKVLNILNEHLAGKNEEYRIEYRVKGEDDEWIWYLDRGKVVERDEKNMPVRMTGTHQNITLQKHREQAVEAMRRQLHEAVNHERTFLQTVIDSAGDPVIAIDLKYNILLINRTAAGLIGGEGGVESFQGMKCYEVFCGAVAPCTAPNYPCPIRAMQDEAARSKLIHNPYHGNGINNTFELDVSPLFDKQGNLYAIIEIARDVTDRLRIEKELRHSQSRLYRLAHHDTLTGLPNRLLFMDRLQQAGIKAKRNGGSVALMYLDLDRFKHVNDTLGHDVGDALLIETGNRLQQQCRMSDTVARLGGDEFVFILDGITSRKDVASIAEKILFSMQQPVNVHDLEIEMSTSIGIALFPDDSSEIEEVIKCADLALYESKEQGRNTYRFFRPDAQSHALSRRVEERELHEAIEKGELFLRFLPVLDLAEGNLAGFDCSLRWKHPARGELDVDDFLPMARQAGLVGEMAKWMVSEVCSLLRRIPEEEKRNIPVAVNMLEELFDDPQYYLQVAAICGRFGIPTERIEHTLPEEVLLNDQYDAVDLIKQAAGEKIPIVLSGFGLGRISPAVLQQLPLKKLKLHSSMPDKVQQDSGALQLMEALINLAHSLGYSVTGEGVRTSQQVELLCRCGCDWAQGSYFSEPLDKEEVLNLLQGQAVGEGEAGTGC